ncbi:Lariat debranching enzyme [Penicillium capsulatum]|uniref:Lariat debranching enzyme n=1 Tax=Penicillium capsulatum TaxID=69766 RepID=A0A9W9IYF7_9EURO|nr:Lariat debranching enzyme [Penicillium capsulatum]KAJ6129163.1 Lariat debranching enzyme [Penicillium capsulatum]
MTPSVRVAVVGCGHGSLNEIYAEVDRQIAVRGWSGVDVVVVGGDFQSLRNADDAACISVPAKYRQLGDFPEYYSGAREAPYLTIFCSGNHEASNYLFELYYGGWAAPNIYFMGAANVLRLGPLRIAGMSGIWKGYDYKKAHSERLPYRYEEISSIYHTREIDVRKLMHLRTQVDVGISHDWPRGIEHFGDFNELFRKKGHLRDDSTHGVLGSQAAREVLNYLRPAYWFSAHLHVRFLAAMPHDGASLRKIAPGKDEPAAWAFEAVPKPPTNAVLAGSASQQNVKPNNLASGKDEAIMSAWRNLGAELRVKEKAEADKYRADYEARKGTNVAGPGHTLTWKKPNGEAQHTVYGPDGSKVKVESEESVRNQDEIALSSSSSSGGSNRSSPNRASPKQASPNRASPDKPPLNLLSHIKAGDSEVSRMGLDGASESNLSHSLVDLAVSKGEEVRSKLPSSFATPPPMSPTSAKKVTPEGVTNDLTKFMSLDKPHNRDRYVELVEVNPVSQPTDLSASTPAPLRLQYDKEWLAITRVFADDLELGNPNARVPPSPNEATALAAIMRAEDWIEQHVVQRGLMDVPLNFRPIAPFYDSNSSIMTPKMPMEYPNNQTEDFCNLIGIKNKFALTDEERAARMEAGARREANRPPPPPGGQKHARGKRAGKGRGGRGSGKKANAGKSDWS